MGSEGEGLERTPAYLQLLPGFLPPPPPPCRKYSVRLGDHSLQNRDAPEQEIQVAQSIQHPCYNNSNPEDHSHDVMLVRMRRSANLGSKVKPIKLANLCPKVGQKCVISGWGTVTSPRGNELGPCSEGEEKAGSPADLKPCRSPLPAHPGLHTP